MVRQVNWVLSELKMKSMTWSWAICPCREEKEKSRALKSQGTHERSICWFDMVIPSPAQTSSSQGQLSESYQNLFRGNLYQENKSLEKHE